MALNLPRFQQLSTLVDSNGLPTASFHIWWDTFASNLETAFNDLSNNVAAIQAAQAAADAAQASANTAQTSANTAQSTATSSYREAARINSYQNPGAGILSASDAGTSATITIATHTRVYPVEGGIDVPDVIITGGSLTGLAYSTTYFVYYDDTTLASTTPTFVATTSSATAQVGSAAGRHFVGYVTTPASGGGTTSGGGSAPPGGGGGGSGGVIP